MGYSPFSCSVHLDAPVAASLIPTCRRKLWLNEGKIIYLLFSPEDKLVQCRQYDSTGMVGSEVFTRLVLEKEALFEVPFMGCEVYWGGSSTVLMPSELHSNLQELRMMRIHVDGDLGAERLRRQPITQHAATLVFELPEAIRHMLEHYVRYYELHHMIEPLIRSSDQLLNISKTHLLLLLGQETVHIIARKDGQLMLCQQYKARTRADVLYYSQAIRQVTGIADHFPVYALGEIGIPFPEAEPLHQFLPRLTVPILPLQLGGQADVVLPHWTFSFLAQ